MYSTLITAVALFAAPAFAAFAINNPDLKQCETSKISWEKTTPPYNLIVVDAADPCGEPLIEIGDFEGSSIQWKALLPAGSIVQLSVADATDDEAWSGNITVGASSDSSCLTASDATTDASTTTSNTATGSTTSGQTTTGTGSGSSTSGGSNTETDEDGSPIVPVGAANAGSNNVFNDNAAPSARSLSTPAMALAAVAAVAALAL